MTKDELLDRLHILVKDNIGDLGRPHMEADAALIEFINDPEIAAAYYKIPKWFS